MSYTLTYSFPATSGLTIRPLFIALDGTVGGSVPNTNDFKINDWYGFTLLVPSGYQGFIGFYDSNNALTVMFAVNPQEGENLDVKVSSVDFVGPGGYPFMYCVNDKEGFPIAGAQVWITTDAKGRNTIAGTLITDSTGKATFELPSGNYYLWVIAARYTFPNPKIITVQ